MVGISASILFLDVFIDFYFFKNTIILRIFCLVQFSVLIIYHIYEDLSFSWKDIRSQRVLVTLTWEEVLAHIVDNFTLCVVLYWYATSLTMIHLDSAAPFTFDNLFERPRPKTLNATYIRSKLLRATHKRRGRVRNVLATDKFNLILTINISLQSSDIPTTNCKIYDNDGRNTKNHPDGIGNIKNARIL